MKEVSPCLLSSLSVGFLYAGKNHVDQSDEVFVLESTDFSLQHRAFLSFDLFLRSVGPKLSVRGGKGQGQGEGAEGRRPDSQGEGLLSSPRLTHNCMASEHKRSDKGAVAVAIPPPPPRASFRKPHFMSEFV